jgi:hypothetical protein
MTNENQGLYDTTVPTPILWTDTLFTPKPFKDSSGKEKGEPKYSTVVLFKANHPDLAPIKVKMTAIARAKWPEADLKTIIFPLKSGTKDNEKRVAKGKKARDFMEDVAFITTRSKYAPRLSGIENGKIVDYEGAALIAAKGKFYGGVEALVEFNFVAKEVDDKRSVTAYLNLVFSTGKGARIGGGKSGADVFKGYVGKPTTENPTEQDDDGVFE